MDNYKLYAAVVRLLFKYNLVPETTEQEQAFMRELVELLKL